MRSGRPYKELGDKLRAARRDAKIRDRSVTQTDVAKALSLRNRSQIGRWETGQERPSHHRLAEHLNFLVEKNGLSQSDARKIFVSVYPDKRKVFAAALGELAGTPYGRDLNSTSDDDASSALGVGEVARVVQSKSKPFLIERVKLEFRNAASMLSHPVVYEFLEEECSRREVFPGHKVRMLRRRIGSFILPIAAGVLSAGVPVRLGKLDLQERKIADVETDEYVRKRDSLIGNTLIGKTTRIQVANA
jgi:transcriptional regulator with XRE-family HTH domain